MPQKPGLNRDLAAERAARRAASQQVRLVPQGLPTVRPDQLMSSPENGRKELHRIEELADSLTSDGMNTAMTVIPPDVYVEFYPQHKEAVDEKVAEGVLFVVHHGHRRLAAAVKAGLSEVPILVRRDVPSLRIAAIQENLQRMGLNPVEEAVEFQAALDEKDENGKQLSQRELAKRAGCSQTYVSHRVALLRLVPALQQAVVNHWLKEQQLLETEGQDSGNAGALLVLPVREAATVYARLRPDLQEAFVRGELAAGDAAAVSKLPGDQQALPSAEDEGDCAAIAQEDSVKTALPVPRGSDSSAEGISSELKPVRNSLQSSPPTPASEGDGSSGTASPQSAPEKSAAAGTAVATREEPRGVIVVQSVEQLALSIIDLLDRAEIEALKEHLSA
ncbi:ParB N-terminal domain-containing protein [Streptomyces sp. NBC_01571]|uniref:ParB/RepB/Spo0J family partition protein n=1 Tax=Streptomyces sp. NBC_01571 TaxID=2975883 RepID=UPI002256C74D|nr:ParB N-terminal domain-containing protein [Streptomyces sp. NBC_01571]MCX4581065.1 ParB N-terminal domain-containing protein [Streptomyces sp. NBC_01571]